MQNEVGWWITEIGGEWYPKAEWAKIDDKWYYFDKRGYMLAGITIVIKGKQYTFDKNGVCLTKKG
jgi:glucan-binding YG repeat protein